MTAQLESDVLGGHRTIGSPFSRLDASVDVVAEDLAQMVLLPNVCDGSTDNSQVHGILNLAMSMQKGCDSRPIGSGATRSFESTILLQEPPEPTADVVQQVVQMLVETTVEDAVEQELWRPIDWIQQQLQAKKVQARDGGKIGFWRFVHGIADTLQFSFQALQRGAMPHRPCSRHIVAYHGLLQHQR